MKSIHIRSYTNKYTV